MRFLALDLETVPCLEMGARVWGIDPTAEDAYEQMLARRKEETEGKSDFLKPAFQRVVGVGMVGVDLAKGTWTAVADAGGHEGELLRKAHLMLQSGPVLVTWNGIAFDLAVLRYRAIYHMLPLPLLYGPANAKAWEKYDYRYGDRHYDLADLLSGYGRSTTLKLSEAAALCGVACKTQGSGDQVLGLWKAGDYGQIRQYVAEDARVTAQIFLRWWVSTGRAGWPAIEALDAQLQITTATP